MNKNAIKKFSIAARKRLIATASDRAGMLGITKDQIGQPIEKGSGFEIYETPAGTQNTLNRNQIEQRRKLASEIESRGFDVVMEEVAYTWFNRICAIRFMEVNDYLPTRVRVLSSERVGKNEPDLLTEAPDVDLGFTDAEREWILDAKETNKLDDLFSMLFIKQCNKLHEILPELFEETEDYTEMLLSLSYTNKDDVVRMLVDGIDEADFNISTPGEDGKPTGQVEIIGWLYQYYNTELKDDTFAKLKKNVKITKERIPAATQLFTPDWIVRYMVENSVGRIWIEHLRAIDPNTDEKDTAEHFGWKYYLPEAKQEPEVDAKLAEIRKSYRDLKPEDILCIDPCMGSGHIIVAQFDVLLDIYRSVGYGERDAAFEIVEHNLHGLDIDKRAYQLAYFAVMMKGRQYNRRFFRGRDDVRPQPKIYAFIESNGINREQLKYLGKGLSDAEKETALQQMNGLLDTFIDAREYGSILNVENCDWALLRRFTENIDGEAQIGMGQIGIGETQKEIQEIIDIGEVMATKHHTVVTNPPYMGSSGMSRKLSEFVKKNYPDSKADLSTACMECCNYFCNRDGFVAMLNIPVWMFLSSYKNLREKLLMNCTLVDMIQPGRGIFGSDFGTTTFVLRKSSINNYVGTYYRLFDLQGEVKTVEEREKTFLAGKGCYESCQSDFSKIPGSPVAYWVNKNVFAIFENKSISEFGWASKGIITGDNTRFLRLWSETAVSDIQFEAKSYIDTLYCSQKWYPCNKGGDFRKWYGNYDYIINWYHNGEEIMQRNTKKVRNCQDYKNEYKFIQAITWTSISASKSSFRLSENALSESAGMTLFVEQKKLSYILGFLNSVVAEYILGILNPTLNFTAGSISDLPLALSEDYADVIDTMVNNSISISRSDWDSFETSWDFQKHPLVRNASSIEASFEQWQSECEGRFNQLKANEEELNHIFIDIYGLQDELTPEEEDKDVTVRKADLGRDIRSLISYAVGCMFGRYSLDMDGLAYAGGDWDSSKYTTFIPDKDNIIPITDEEYFEDDIVGLFCSWLKKVYGADTLEENLDFIAKALGNKGDTSRDVLRNYFLKDFFKDHCNTYSVTGSGKRPIYWLFDSGKQNGFKALIYLHRYDQDTVGRVRTDYLHRSQKAIEQAMSSAQYTLENSRSGSEKSKATKRISKYTKQLAEIQLYDEAIAHIANQRIQLDLDDGVKVNYAKFQGVEVSREGMKTVKVDLLAKI